MNANHLSGASGAYAGVNGTYQESADSGREGDWGGSTSDFSPMMFLAGLGIAAGATYLFTRVIRGLPEDVMHSSSVRTSRSTADRQPHKQMVTVDHFNRLPGEKRGEFTASVFENLKLLGFKVGRPTEDIFAASTREEIRQRINANFKKIALLVHPDKSTVGDDFFKVAVNARDDLLRRLSDHEGQPCLREHNRP